MVTRISTTTLVRFDPAASRVCTHLDAVRTVLPDAAGCSDCLATGDGWAHLRICMTCGHLGCCDDSVNRHARNHFERTDHPIMRSVEIGDTWGWCFVDDELLFSVPCHPQRGAIT